MTLLDAVKSFGPKITENYRETRFCDFAPPDETVGVIDVSASGNGSRGIAFLIDSMIVKLDGAARRDRLPGYPRLWRRFRAMKLRSRTSC